MWIATSTATLSVEERTVSGYECSRPIENEAIILDNEISCDTMLEPEDSNVNNITYLVVQKADYVRFHGYFCEAYLSKIAFYCRTDSHMTFNPEGTTFNRRMGLKAHECMTLVARDEFVMGDGKKAKGLKINAWNYLSWQSVGTIAYGQYSVWCDGGIHKDRWGKEREEMNVVDYAQIFYKETDLMADDDGNVFSLDPAVKLDGCRLKDEKCRTGDGTWTWFEPTEKEKCPYFLARETHGADAEANGKKVFVSEDTTLLRFVHGATVTGCGHPLTATNYDKLFLTTAVNEPLFKRELDFREASDLTYVNVQDDFFRHEWYRYVKKAFNSALRSECRSHKERQGTLFAVQASRQQAVVEGHTAHLGGGVYATAAAEGWYKYRCRMIDVVAREADHCYSALPVTLSSTDRQIYMTARMFTPGPELNETEARMKNEELKMVKFYKEPKTERIITEATRIPCREHHPQFYQNKFGQYFTVTPEFRLMPRPRVIAGNKMYEMMLPEIEEIDTEEGGIYSPKYIREKELISQVSNLRDSINQRFVVQYGPAHNPDTDIQVKDLFKETENLDFEFWGPFLRWVETNVGLLCVITLLCLLLNGLRWLVGLLIRLRTVQRNHKGCAAVLAALFPSLVMELLSRVASPEDPMSPAAQARRNGLPWRQLETDAGIRRRRRDPPPQHRPRSGQYEAVDVVDDIDIHFRGPAEDQTTIADQSRLQGQAPTHSALARQVHVLYNNLRRGRSSSSHS